MKRPGFGGCRTRARCFLGDSEGQRLRVVARLCGVVTRMVAMSAAIPMRMSRHDWVSAGLGPPPIVSVGGSVTCGADVAPRTACSNEGVGEPAAGRTAPLGAVVEGASDGTVLGAVDGAVLGAVLGAVDGAVLGAVLGAS